MYVPDSPGSLLRIHSFIIRHSAFLGDSLLFVLFLRVNIHQKVCFFFFKCESLQTHVAEISLRALEKVAFLSSIFIILVHNYFISYFGLASFADNDAIY